LKDLVHERSKNLSLRLKLANDGDKTTLSGREFQVLITRWEKKCASRAEGVKLVTSRKRLRYEYKTKL